MIIYKKYNQKELNLQYNNRHHVPDFVGHLQRWENLSRLTEKKHKVIKDIPYGNGPRECLDIFHSSNKGSKTLVFIHGGYWQKFDKSSFHFIADGFAGYGITTVIINYPLMPSVTMDEVVKSCLKAIDWIHSNIAQWNGDPDQLYIAGHSAGGHLAAMLMTKENDQNDKSFIKGVCAISGLFDLEPIQLSNINDVLQMDRATAIRNSPIQKSPVESSPLLLAVGADETNEFIDQSRELYNNWKNKNKGIDCLEIQGMNHFSILSSIDDRNSLLHESIVRMMLQ
jgi:arylformamidase